MITSNIDTSITWFVGAAYSGTNDQTERFLAEGIWENGFETKYLDVVRSMRPGERIAIKAAYTRKHGLPFDNRGNTVSVMAIKAIGVITENPNDGRRVHVQWTLLPEPREWYFYTYQQTIWRVQAGSWKTDGLIAFAFNNQSQNIERFRNDPYWKERFGTQADEERRFEWTVFYEAVADALLTHRQNRGPLLKAIREIADRVDGLGYLGEDEYAHGHGFLRDICPFTVLGMFNRGVTEANRKVIAREMAAFLQVGVPVPASFEGIPILNNLRSWFFPREKERDPAHIDSLWNVFEAALKFADDEDDADGRDAFADAYDDANGRKNVGWNLTFGLYWARPWSFLSLDQGTQTYLTTKLALPVPRNGPKRRCSASDYLHVIDNILPRFQEPTYPVHSFPELSLQAWRYTGAGPKPVQQDDDAEPVVETAVVIAQTVLAPSYTADDIQQEGCFLAKTEVESILDRLRVKKNLILQGPPGTGKTWLAKRLAYALIGRKDERRLRAVQFHPSLSYEDFVRGWRPAADGKLALANGVFMDAIRAASDDTTPFVVVIEEINRGNPAQIFGELLTLLEAGKRTPSEALELTYPDSDGVRRAVHIPENLYVVGTMNIADRSLALVDLALRRRFAFVGLEPMLGESWRDWVVKHCGVDAPSAVEIQQRLLDLNRDLADDARLGKQFCVGHSYVTPSHQLDPNATRQWFRHVVETEIGPLLDEYWFDAPDRAEKARARLIEGW